MERIFYVTTPIYYPNAVPHIGTAYTTIAADVLTRFRRICGEEAYFLTGTDEHAQKVQEAAKGEGVSAREYVDRIVLAFKEVWRGLSIEYDDFIRTTENRHIKVAQSVFQTLLERGKIYKGYYEGWYCVPCESFWLESQLTATPDGKKLCPNGECGRPVGWVKDEEYFFKLSEYQEPLLAYYKAHQDFVRPRSRFNEVVSFVERGLQDICVSRKGMKWGIQVPGDPEFVIYVWIDALTNYITAAGYLSDEKRMRSLWPASLHLVGKDILRFHAVIWPAMLMALGLDLPEKVFANGWLVIGGEKISKSRGVKRNLVELIEEYGSDPLRYFLLREGSFGQDFEFSEEALIRRLNTDLADDLGNLVHRTLSMLERYRNGKVEKPSSLFQDADEGVIGEVNALPGSLRREMDELAFHEALQEIWKVVVSLNRYVEITQPWNLNKEKKEERLSQVMYVLCEGLAALAVLLYPFIPVSAQNIWEQLGLQGQVREQRLDRIQWGAHAEFQCKKGTPLFPKKEAASLEG